MEEVVHAGESLVDVLRRVVDAMIVVPERVHRLPDVTGAGMSGVDTSQHVRVVVVVEFTAGVEEAWEAVRFRRSVSVVQVGRRRVYSEAVVVGGQLVELAHEDRLAVPRDEERPRENSVEAPKGRRLNEVWRRLGQKRLLVHLIKLLWRELCVRLMRDCAALAAGGVRRRFAAVGQSMSESVA